MHSLCGSCMTTKLTERGCIKKRKEPSEGRIMLQLNYYPNFKMGKFLTFTGILHFKHEMLAA